MKNQRWFSFKDAAKYMGRTPQSFYALMQGKDLEMDKYLLRVDGKRMINRDGLTLLVGNPPKAQIINLKLLTNKQKCKTLNV